MHERLICMAAILMVIVCTAGCGEEAQPEQAKDARITVGRNTLTTRELSCTQMEWSMTIDTKSGPSRTHSFLQLGGETPIAKTVDIRNFDGFSGVAGEGGGSADVSLANNAYVITCTVEVSDPEIPGKTRTAPVGSKPLINETAPPHSKRHGGASPRLQLIPNDLACQIAGNRSRDTYPCTMRDHSSGRRRVSDRCSATGDGLEDQGGRYPVIEGGRADVRDHFAAQHLSSRT